MTGKFNASDSMDRQIFQTEPAEGRPANPTAGPEPAKSQTPIALIRPSDDPLADWKELRGLEGFRDMPDPPSDLPRYLQNGPVRLRCAEWNLDVMVSADRP